MHVLDDCDDTASSIPDMEENRPSNWGFYLPIGPDLYLDYLEALIGEAESLS
jgi:hypothetical protein